MPGPNWISPNDRKAFPGNYEDRLQALEWDIRQLKAHPVVAGALSEITTDAGVLTAGMFVATTGIAEPTDAGFSGCFMSATPLTFGSNTWNIGGVNAGVLQCGMNAVDGQFYFGGGAGVLGATGMKLTYSQYPVAQIKWYDGANLVGLVGTNVVVNNAIAIGMAVTGEVGNVNAVSWISATDTSTNSALVQVYTLGGFGYIYAGGTNFVGLGIGVNPARQQLSVGAYIDIYSGGANTPTVASIRANTAGSIAINPNGASAQLYLNWDTGGIGIQFGNGASSSVGYVDTSGNAKFLGGFGCNTKTPQTAYASGGALAAYVTGAFGLNSNANMLALYNLVVALRAMAVANGTMS